LSRERLYTDLPNAGGLLLLDWNLVNTSVGAMLEPVSYRSMETTHAAVNVYDAAIDRLTEIDDDQVFSLLGVNGGSTFVSYAR